MSVTLHLDNETTITFNDQADALYHIARQGSAGVVNLRDDDGSVVWTRKQLEAKARQANEGELTINNVRKLAKE